MDIIYIKNELAKGVVELLKADYDDNTLRLSGAVFDLYMLNAETGVYELYQSGLTTGADGRMVAENLPLGSYRLIETQCPTGYHLCEEHYYEFVIAQDEHGDIIEVEPITALNQLLASAQLIKQDAEDASLLLPGAVFTLWRYDEETSQYVVVNAGLTTDENGQITVNNLEPGDYKFTETAAPDGYYLPDGQEVLFTIEYDADGWMIPLDPIVVTNQQLGAVEIIKVDQDDDTIRLEGAVFSLYMLNEETGEYDLLDSGLTTDASGSLIIKNLEPGSYKLVETQCPTGYVLPATPEVTFVITL